MRLEPNLCTEAVSSSACGTRLMLGPSPSVSFRHSKTVIDTLAAWCGIFTRHAADALPFGLYGSGIEPVAAAGGHHGHRQ